jgi:hypothetical protein
MRGPASKQFNAHSNAPQRTQRRPEWTTRREVRATFPFGSWIDNTATHVTANMTGLLWLVCSRSSKTRANWVRDDKESKETWTEAKKNPRDEQRHAGFWCAASLSQCS